MRQSLMLVVALMMLVGGVLAGCSGSSQTDSSASSDSGTSGEQTLTYANTTKVVGLSPIMTNDSVSARVIMQIYETLFTRDPDTMEIKPLLAKSYETPDKKTWVIHLKEGIQFTNGTELTAEDVKYTFDKLRDPDTGAPRASLLASVKKVTAKDKYTVVIKTKEPYGPMLAALAHYNASIISKEADQKNDLMKKPVGTGPYKLKEWVTGDHVTVTKNSNYWGEDPALNEATFKVVPDVNTAISMLQTGEVDLIDGIPSSQWQRVKSLQNVKTTKKPGTRVSYMAFNFNKDPMSQLKFRKAVSYAINRKSYVKQLNGLGVQSNSIIGPKVSGYDKSAEDVGYTYNPEKAKKMIEENGWKGLELKMLVANRENYMKMAQIVQEQLEDAGLKVKLQSMEWGTFLDVSTQGKFDITFLGWGNTTGDGSELLYPNLHSDNMESSNRANYNNSKFDQLVDASRFSVDQDVRQEKLDAANKIAIKDAAWVVMNHAMVTAAYRDDVKGFKISPTADWLLKNIERE